jgi:hypothetical protein
MTTTVTVRLPRLHQGQQRIKAELSRFNVVDCGRRFGKTTLGIDLVTPILAGRPVGWFSPTYKMMLEVWRELSNIFQPVVARASMQERRLELITGGVLEMWSLENQDAARGRKYQRVIIDEAAMVAGLETAWQAAIRPTLTDYEGDAFFLSTPKGHNFFKTLFDYGQDPLRSEWRSWQMPTLANPFIKPAEVEAARLELPERVFRQEYLAEFLANGSFFVNVDGCATAQVEAIGRPGDRYVIGVDWARASGGDYTVFAVVNATTRRMAALVRLNGVDFVSQQQRLAAVWQAFNRAEILAEYNSIGGPQIEALQAAGLPVTGFTTTAGSKHQIISALHLALERGDLQILAEPVLINELKAFEARQRAGLPVYGAPAGQHDDCVMALALAWWPVGKPAVALGSAWRGNS